MEGIGKHLDSGRLVDAVRHDVDPVRQRLHEVELGNLRRDGVADLVAARSIGLHCDAELRELDIRPLRYIAHASRKGCLHDLDVSRILAPCIGMCLPVVEDEGGFIHEGCERPVETEQERRLNLRLLNDFAVKPDHKAVRCDGRREHRKIVCEERLELLEVAAGGWSEADALLLHLADAFHRAGRCLRLSPGDERIVHIRQH